MSDFLTRMPTFQELLTQAKSVLLTHRTDAALGDGSDAEIQTTTQAHLHHGAHLHIKLALKNLIPTQVQSEWAANAWCWFFGLSDGSGSYGMIKARGSTGTDALEITATGAGPWADIQGEQFEEDATGLLFEVSESFTPTATGTYSVDVAAVDTGLETNLESADSPALSWTSTPAGYSSTITLTADLDNGANKETVAEARARLADLLQSPGLSATPEQWRRVIEESITGTIDGYVYPKRENAPAGWGRVDYTALARGESGSARILSSDQSDIVETAVEDNLPVRMVRNSRILTPVAEPVRIELDLELKPNAPDTAKCDWDAEDLKTTIDNANCNEGTKLIACNDNVHLHLTDQGSERVIIETGGTYHECIVDRVGTGGGLASDKYFSITNWPFGTGTTPTDARHVMSGGGVIQDTIDDIQAYVDTMAPEAEYSSVRYLYAPTLADDTLRVKVIQATALDASDYTLDIHGIEIDGVADTDCSPTASDPSAVSTINFLTATEIVVWEDK